MMARGMAFEFPAARAPARTAHSPFARVEVHRDANGAVLDVWRDLEAAAPHSIYQSRAWLLPWIDTLGRKAGLAPFFVIARDGEDRPVALLCLGTRRSGPVRIATFLGGKDSNFNLPLVRPGSAWTAADWRRLLRQAARALGTEGPDAFALLNQPLEWEGVPNTLRVLPSQESPSAAYGTRLNARVEEVFAAKLSKERRKKLRKKETRLGEMGVVTHRAAATAEERDLIIRAFLAQRVDRFRAQNICSDFNDPRMRQFIEQASAPGPAGAGIELHALLVGERVAAVYGGAARGGQWSGMFNSFDMDPEIARCSPGDLLLMRVIAAQCAAGLALFDLGIGDASYKTIFCGEAIALFDSFVAVNALGFVASQARAAASRGKRIVKRHPRLLDAAKRLRAALTRAPTASPAHD